MTKINPIVWNVTIPIPQIPSLGSGDGGGIKDPEEGPVLPIAVFFNITITATDIGMPPHTTIQIISGEAIEGNSNWHIITTNQTPDAAIFDFPN